MNPEAVEVMFLTIEIAFVVVFTLIWYRVATGGKK